MFDWTAITGFDWDEGNARKSADKHGVTQAEAEQVFFNEPVELVQKFLRQLLFRIYLKQQVFDPFPGGLVEGAHRSFRVIGFVFWGNKIRKKTAPEPGAVFLSSMDCN